MTGRAVVWSATAPLRWAAVGSIRIYRFLFAGAFAGQCRFHPSCSHYAEEAIAAHGLVRGCSLAAWRLLRCNPFGRGGLDPVPGRVVLHDAVICNASAVR
jgi:uncharacterized protein